MFRMFHSNKISQCVRENQKGHNTTNLRYFVVWKNMGSDLSLLKKHTKNISAEANTLL